MSARTLDLPLEERIRLWKAVWRDHLIPILQQAALEKAQRNTTDQHETQEARTTPQRQKGQTISGRRAA